MSATRRTHTALRVQKFLVGLRYPASKADVLRRAGERAADEQVMLALLALPERSFASPIALSCEVARQAREAARAPRAA